MSGHRSTAELRKLAHQLGVPAARLDFLAGVQPGELRTLRSQIGDALFDADRQQFTKIVAVSRLVPTALAAKITEHALPPLLAARTAELLEPARAVELVNRLGDAYLADVSAAMDPSRCPEVIAQIPPDRVAAVAGELARRGEWVVMGGFVSVVSPAALRASMAVLDGEQLLRVGFVMDDTGRLDDIVAMLSDAQLDQVLAAAAEHDLWRELDELLGAITPQHADRLARRYAGAPAHVVAAAESAVTAGLLSKSGIARLELP